VIGDEITLVLKAKCIAGNYSDVPMSLHFTIGAADIYEDEEHERHIGTVAGVMGGHGGVELQIADDGDVWYIDAPTFWLALQEALRRQKNE
jgi:hypothetical protein